MMPTNVLCILMWRHLKQRKHRICYTLMEICSGVFVFFIMFLLRQATLHVKSSTRENVKQINIESIDKVFYSPSNYITDSLMLRVGQTLNITKTIFSPDTVSQGLWGFQNERNLREFLRMINHTKPIGVIIFKDPEAGLPSLKYSIWISKPYVHVLRRTHSYLYDFIFPQLSTENPPALINLQWALDKAYLEELSGFNLLHEIETVMLSNLIAQELEKIQDLLLICTIIAPLPFFLINTSRLVQEKRAGLKGLLKLVGVSSNMLRMSNLLETLVLGAVYGFLIMICLKVTANPILPSSNGFIVAITIILHFLNINSLAFITTTLSQDSQHSGGVALFVYLLMYLLDSFWYNSEISKAGVYFVMWLLPHAPMYLFWDEVIHLERTGEGSVFSNIIYSHTSKSVPILLVWFYCIIQLVVILILAWYLDLVRPGTYGVAKKWNFIFKKEFWCYKKKKVTFHVTVERNVKLLRDDRFFEKVPRHAEIAIKVANVTKVFHSLIHHDTVALESVNLDVYKGEVAVLLGANGAGKTTLLSIITGMYSATSGSVYVNGLDASARLQEIRKDIGLCPQENVTFDYLTVKENIILFESLKGNVRDARSGAEHLMVKLKLIDKADYYSYQLSTGMKRCLQVACAMAGGSEVLVLDEPTSGMDADSRHSLWDLLLSIRGDTTILMTTTFIEEADALGDRIALLNYGKLRCYATPQFLKNAIGTGFNLELGMKHQHNIEPIQELVLKSVPDSKVNKVERRRVTFMLPTKEEETFPKLFDTLEENRKKLGIISIGVGMSMDDVFLSFIEDDDIMDDLSFYAQRNDDMLLDEKLKGFRLRIQQFRCLMRRNFMFLWHTKHQFIVLQVIVPVVGLLIVTCVSNNQFDQKATGSSTADNYTVVYNNGPYRHTDVINSFHEKHQNIEFVRSKNVSSDLTRLCNAYYYNMGKIKNLYGIEMFDNYTKIYYPASQQLYLSNIINVFSNLYLSLHAPYAANSIDLIKYDVSYRADYTKKEPKRDNQLTFWTMWVVFLIILSLAPYVWMSVKERTSGIRYNHMVAGCSPSLLWIASLAVHMMAFAATIPVPLLLILFLFESDDTFNQIGFLVALFIVIMIFTMAFLMHLYSLSFLLTEIHALGQIYIMSLILALTIPALVDALKTIAVDIEWTWLIEIPLEYLSYFSPIYTFLRSLYYMTEVARMNAICRFNKELCPNIDVKDFDKETCCASPSVAPFPYYSVFRGSFHLELLIFHFFFYFVLAIVLQNRMLQKCLERIANFRYKPPRNVFSDPNVLQEKTYVENTMKELKNKTSGGQPVSAHSDLLLVSDLHKNYVNPTCTKRCNAVKGVSFALKPGECLGVLGRNSAGKTTTLLMIAGLQVATRGQVYANGCFLNTNIRKYIQHVGLTPAFGGLDEFLSGYENLKLLSALQGRPVLLAERWATKCLRYMGLEAYGALQVDEYSAGCLRRLMCARALALSPRVSLLDEPAAHVDLRARPLVTRALVHARRTGAALLVAEHSMDWRDMTTVFTRVAIMLRGELAALGSASELHETLATGLTAKLKIKQASVLRFRKKVSNETLPLNNKSGRLLSLKLDFKQQFPTSILRDEHLSILYYHIKADEDKLLYSDMFTKLQQLKTKYPDILEDYTLSETTVEEVFCKLEKQVDYQNITMGRQMHIDLVSNTSAS